MPRGSSKTLSVIVPVETQDRLEKLAKFKRWSVSQTARILIEEGLDRHEAEERKND
jgi:predicted DNA-binding protein